MRINRALLFAFGRFHAVTLNLKPGLNILYGENEAGKTTIQRFLLGMLYGFKRRSARREYTEDLARYRPWSGGEYRGGLTYSLEATGQSYRVERIFEPSRESVRLYDDLTGADLTGSFAMDRRKELLFAEEHLRLSQEVFTSTAWVGQLEVGRLEMGKELVTRVANMQESGREDLSVRNALRWMEERSREIGTERSSTRPYARVLRQIAETRAELERARMIREQTLEWEVGLRESREAIARLQQEIAEAERLLAWARLHEAEERQQRVMASTTQLEQANQAVRALSEYAAFPAALRSALREAELQAVQAEATLARHRSRLNELNAASRAVEERLGEFAGLVSLGPDVASEVAASARSVEAGGLRLPGLRTEAARLAEQIDRLDEAISPLQPAADAGEAALSQIERLEQAISSARSRLNQGQVEGLRLDLARLEQARGRAGGWGWLGLAAGLGVAAGAFYLTPLLPDTLRLPVASGAALLGLLALLPFARGRRSAALLGQRGVAVRRQLTEAEAALAAAQEQITHLEGDREQVLRGLGLLSVGELRNQLIRFEQLSARRDGQQLRLDSLQDEIRQAEELLAEQRDRLAEILGAALGIDPAEVVAGADTLERFQAAYTEAQRIRFEREALRREAEELQARMAAATEQSVSARAEQAVILRRAGVSDQAAFEEACRLHEAYQQAEREAEGLRNAMAGLVGSEDRSRSAAAADRLRSLVSGEPPESVPAVAEIEDQIRHLTAERSDWQVRASDLAARVETAQGEISDTAELERALTALLEERQAMDRELAALELARSVITEVSSQIHREFAPRLNEAMGQVVTRLTDGKYQSVTIDETLTIRAIADGQTVPVTALSGGTVDQFYLALRVAILDLLTEGEESVPLFLDDPFVQYDQQRLEATMAHLAQLAESRQVVLMTCHQREVQAGRQVGAQVIDLNQMRAGTEQEA